MSVLRCVEGQLAATAEWLDKRDLRFRGWWRPLPADKVVDNTQLTGAGAGRWRKRCHDRTLASRIATSTIFKQKETQLLS